MTSQDYSAVQKNGLESTFYVVISDTEINATSKNIANNYFKNNTPKGFRKGKVPAGFKQKEFRSSAISQAANKAISVKLTALGLDKSLFTEPEFDFVENTAGQDVVCKIKTINMPELDLDKLINHKVTLIKCEIPEEEVTNSYNRVLDDFSSWSKLESPVVAGSGVTVTFKGLSDRKLKFRFPENTNSEQQYIRNLLLSSLNGSSLEADKYEKFLDSALVALAALLGKEQGAEVPVKGFKEITLILDEVSSLIPPELTPDFLKSIGVVDGKSESLKQSLKELLEFQIDKKINEFYNHQFNQYCEKHLVDIKVPESLLEKEMQASNNTDRDEVAKSLKSNLVMSSLIRQGELVIDQEKVEAEMSYQYQGMFNHGGDNKKLRSMLENYARNVVAANQAVAFAISKMQQTEIKVDFSELDNYIKGKIG